MEHLHIIFSLFDFQSAKSRLSFYDIQAARAEWTDFFRWSVYTRGSVILFFVAFVLLGLAPPVLLLFGLVDLLGATWTGLALRSSQPG